MLRAISGAENAVSNGRSIKFLTLTSHERLSASQTLKVWPHAWKKLHTRANRADGKATYLMVPERHLDGRLHMHAVVTWSLDERWWKDHARACGLGFMADTSEIETPTGVGFYLVKYVTKTMHDMTWPKGWRRVRTSRDWPKLADQTTPENWTFSVLEKADNLMSEVTRFSSWGERVLMLDHRAAWDAIAAIENDGEFS